MMRITLSIVTVAFDELDDYYSQHGDLKLKIYIFKTEITDIIVSVNSNNNEH